MLELVTEVQPSFCPSVQLFKWQSRRTGLQAVLIKRQSPSVQGYFAVASEANDNSGCPHTLEHIVFMGSRKYPFKGLLDKLSAAQMSSTNAWTSQDQTIYTLSSAGFEGFFNLLPVYLDHVLNATVTKSTCMTEVYHVDGNGDEKGVVYSEMQAVEHSSDNLMTIEAQKILFNEDSGYATNTGGCLDALRELEPETIRQYHLDVYRPDNLSVIVVGDLSPQELEKALNDIDKDLPESTKNRPRPFVESALSTASSPLKETVVRSLEFPDSSESSGEILASWLGPSIHNLVANTALQVVTTYLWMQDSGKLEHKFVNVPEERALASEVAGFTNEYMMTQVNLYLMGVDASKLDQAAAALIDYLEKSLLDELDYEFLQQCIDTVYDGFKLMAEEESSTFVNLAISEFLYGNSDTFSTWLGSAEEFETIRRWTVSDWRSFITEFIVKPPKACIVGKPSKDAHAKVEKEKKERTKATKIGMDLGSAAQRLQQAIADNDRAIPNTLLTMLPRPDVSRVRFITSRSAATSRLTQHGLPGCALLIDSQLQTLLPESPNARSLALNVEQISSQFVTIKLFISTQAVDQTLLALVPVILSSSFMSPMKLDSGRELSPEEVAQESQKDLLSAYVACDPGLREFLTISVKAKASHYSKAVEWVKRCMFNVEHKSEHIAILISRHLKNLPNARRSEDMLLQSSLSDMLLSPRSLAQQSDMLITEEAVRELEHDLDSTVRKATELSSQLFRSENIRGLIYGDITNISTSIEGGILGPWNSLQRHFLRADNDLRMTPVALSNKFLSEKGKHPSVDGILTLCAASDSTCLMVVANGPSEYGHPDLPALTLVNTFLSMTEGPLWNSVRGRGYAYGVSTSTSVQLGKVVLSIQSASDGLRALEACKATISDVASGHIAVDNEALASAVSTIVADLAANLADPASAIEEKFNDTVLKGYQPQYVLKIIEEVQSVTISQFLRALKVYLLPLFSPRSSVVFAVSPPSDGIATRESLESMGYKIKVREAGDETQDSDEEDSCDDSSIDDSDAPSEAYSDD